MWEEIEKEIDALSPRLKTQEQRLKEAELRFQQFTKREDYPSEQAYQAAVEQYRRELKAACRETVRVAHNAYDRTRDLTDEHAVMLRVMRNLQGLYQKTRTTRQFALELTARACAEANGLETPSRSRPC